MTILTSDNLGAMDDDELAALFRDRLLADFLDEDDDLVEIDLAKVPFDPKLRKRQ